MLRLFCVKLEEPQLRPVEATGLVGMKCDLYYQSTLLQNLPEPSNFNVNGVSVWIQTAVLSVQCETLTTRVKGRLGWIGTEDEGSLGLSKSLDSQSFHRRKQTRSTS